LRKKKDDAQLLVDAAVKGMQEKKALDIVVLSLKTIKGAVSDYFVICSGSSDKQVDAIAGSVEEEVYKAMQEDPWHKEGQENKEWILLDYVNVVVHVFLQERRNFYGLEELWGDSGITRIQSESAELRTF
jgi:ribosome-associated protein